MCQPPNPCQYVHLSCQIVHSLPFCPIKFAYINYFSYHKQHFVDGKVFNYEEIVSFCRKQGIAIYDTAQAVRRLHGNAADEHLFKCRLVITHVTLLEHEAAKWLKPKELDSVKWLPADEEIIEELKR